MKSDIKLAFFTNPQRETAVNGLHRAIHMATNLGCKCLISEELKRVGFPWADEIGDQKPDFMLAFGGDGTILRAADEAVKYGTPILGVNFGRIGFLSEVDPDGLENGLKRLISGDYELDSRTMLRCSVNGGTPHHFLNDVLLYKRTFSGGNIHRCGRIVCRFRNMRWSHSEHIYGVNRILYICGWSCYSSRA